MPVESERARAPRSATSRPLEPQPPVSRPVDGWRAPAAAPRTPHDEHELPDGRYLIAYRSVPNA